MALHDHVIQTCKKGEVIQLVRTARRALPTMLGSLCKVVYLKEELLTNKMVALPRHDSV